MASEYEFYKIKDYPAEIFEKFYRKKIYLKLQKKVKTVAFHKPGGGLGDLVLSIPIFRALKKIFPQAKIIYFGSYPRPFCDSLFKSISCIDEYIHDVEPGKGKIFKGFFPFFKRFFRKFDLIVSGHVKFLPSLRLWLLGPRYYLSRNPLLSRWKVFHSKFYSRRDIHVISKMAFAIKILGFKNFDLSPEIKIPEKFLSFSENFLNKFNGPFISIIPTAGDPYKNWSEERYALLADRLTQMGYKIILIGNERQKNVLLKVKNRMSSESIIPLLEEKKFGEDPIYSFGLLKPSSLVIGNDGGGLHLASLAGCSIIGIYGPSTPVKWGPLGKRNIAIYKNLKCSPCSKKELKSCKIGRRCLRDITVDEVIKAAEFILEKRSEENDHTFSYKTS